MKDLPVGIESYLESGLIGILIFVVGFFLKGLVSRLEKGNEKLTALDKSLAVLLTEFKSLKEINALVQRENERLNKELEAVRKDRHDLVDHITKLELRIITVEERQSNAI